MNAARAPVALVVLALLGFAANSLLCRVALRPPAAIDPLTFTLVRLAGGALVLSLVARFSSHATPGGNWRSAFALFAYATAFSVAYVRITAGIGALVLFAAVQLTMFGAGLRSGERLRPLQWLGFATALAGLVILTWRGLTAPDPLAALLMAVAGISWGVYSLRGRRSTQALADTAGNFGRAVPLAVLSSVLAFRGTHVSPSGLVLALVSGGLASGVVYCIWYTTLPRMTATSASIVQLAVPVIAAAGGIAFLHEQPTLRLALATVTILSGVALALLGRRVRKTASEPLDERPGSSSH
jgi:drug/metabolite transporter (DMT)-like permease